MIGWNRATFVIQSESRTAASITEALGVQPHQSHEIGDLRMRKDGTPHKHAPFYWSFSAWMLDAENDGTGPDESGTASIAAVIAPLRGKGDVLDELRSDCDIRIWWSGDSDSSQGGYVLPEELIAELAPLKCPLYMTAFLREPEEAEDSGDR